MLFNKAKSLEKKIAYSESYKEWKKWASEHDSATKRSKWKEIEESQLYDYRSIKRRLEALRSLRINRNYPELLFTLNEGIHGNMGGMGNGELYSQCKVGTKNLVANYVKEINAALLDIADTEIEGISSSEKRDFFERAHHCFGQSAFMMSGSGNLGYFHLGVVKALWAEGLLPKIISGSSGGALIGALISTRNEEESIKLFNKKLNVTSDVTNKSIFNKLLPNVASEKEFRELVSRLVPDLTFYEAFKKSGRILNISIAPSETHQTSRLLNVVTSPNVLIREAVLASCAIPGIYPPVTLKAKDKYGLKKDYLPSRKWVDGAISDDLPAKRLARLYAVNHYIVSQTNPHILPFISDSKGASSLTGVVKKAVTRTSREWINAGASALEGPLSFFPRLNQVSNTLLSIINQDYIGDINILPPFRFTNPARLLASLSNKEVQDLIKMGERAAWPKLEMIRVQTSIGKTLNKILDRYNESASFRTEQMAASAKTTIDINQF